MAESTRMGKFKANEGVVRIETVGTFAKQKLARRNQFFTSFVHDMVTDTRTTTTRRFKLKAPSLQKISTKIQSLPKT